MKTTEPHGRASLKGDLLTITTQAKRGPKLVENRQYYRVVDLRPDKRVAHPAFALQKMELAVGPCDLCVGVGGTLVFIVADGVLLDRSATCKACGGDGEKLTLEPTGEEWHVAVNEWGPQCSCPDRLFRGEKSGAKCKHIRAAMAVGLIPKPYGATL